ncbi:hypothetical protein [Salinisphaera sp. Q1T1-3]|uniref:hypothetical protein n=1 Tax=Salinisphaera sp. Q1T1-3 TaxID=2321229 RepID=UPI000E75101F|nr:hypothetical protein [Salinisphaera sp. Q1T1-3]RJS93799.1 hypothetical protein D3260_06985 [Salinisphaera sp. Q1T1-3]
MSTALSATFICLLVLGIVWFVLLTLLFRRLEKVHPHRYTRMGRPDLFRNHAMKTGFATLRFVIRREHRSLKDPRLGYLSDTAMAVFVIYIVLFFSLCLGVFFVEGH